MSVQVWAYANLGYDPGALMDAVAQCSEDRMRGFTPQNISNILWAFAKLGMFPVLLTAKQCSRPWISDSADSSCLPQVCEHLNELCTTKSRHLLRTLFLLQSGWWGSSVALASPGHEPATLLDPM